jgi:hypothetical protein
MTDNEPIATTHPAPRQWSQAISNLRDRLMAERPRAFLPGSTRRCPQCAKRALESRYDLVRESVAGAIAVVHRNLHGARCTACGTEYLESYEELAIEDAGWQHALANYQAKVTSVSGRNLGTYWPKDVVRVMALHNQDALHVQVLDQDTMLIRRHHNHD